jgi:hypothetical protein
MNKKLIVFSFLFFVLFSKALELFKLVALTVTIKAKSTFLIYSPIYEDSPTLIRNRFQSNLLEV